MQKRLTYRGHISPFLMHSLPATATVTNGTVTIGDSVLDFAADAYADGTPIKVWIDRNFVCQSFAEIEAEQAERERQRQENAERRRMELARQDAENTAFNAALSVPVRWQLAVKPVLSGLTENSMGNGCKANTVYHIRLLDDLDAGRLHRDAGKPLCSSDWGSFGELVNWCGQDGMMLADVTPRVTCKKCLEIARRWQA